MSTSSKLPALLVAATLAFSSRADAQHRYTVTGLGVLPDFDQSYAEGINDAGQVVGHTYDIGTNTRRAFVWTNGAMLELPPLPGGQFSWAHAINTTGEIAGQSESRDLFNFSYYYGYLFDGGMTALTAFPDRNTQARDVNDFGVVAGKGLFNSLGPAKAAVWTTPTLVVDLGGLIPDGGSEAFALNEAGWVVGEATTFDGSGYWSHAFVWDGATMTDLGTFAGPSNFSRATDINESNQVVGRAQDGTPQDIRAFLWEGTTLIDLGTLGPNLSLSEAHAINDRGQVVGAGNSHDPWWHAILWEDGKILDLNDLVVPGHGWELVVANDINNRGEIVGYGYPPGESSFHAFLLRPFRPRTLQLHVGP